MKNIGTHILFSFFLLITSRFVSAQYNSKTIDGLSKKLGIVTSYENGLAVFRNNKNKEGLADSLGNITCKPKYDYIYRFFEGKAEAGMMEKDKMKRGFINTSGDIVIPFIYDYVMAFSHGQAIVTLKNKVGVIDAFNKQVIPLSYTYITDANNNRFIVEKSGSYAIFNKQGVNLSGFGFKNLERFYNYIAIATLNNNSAALIDTNAQVLFKPIFNHTILNFKNGYATIKNSKTNKIGVIDSLGNFTTPCIYNNIELANNAIIVEQNKKFGICNYFNKIITPITYNAIYKRDNNRFLVLKNEKYGVLNDANVFIIEPIFKHINEYNSEAYYILKNDEDLHGVLNIDGSVKIPFQYNFLNYSENKIFCLKNGEPLILNVLDTFKNIYLPKTYKLVSVNEQVSPNKNSFEVVIEDKKYGLINDNGDLVIPIEYDEIINYYNQNRYVVKLNGKYGVISTKNILIKPIKYDFIQWRKEVFILKQKGEKDEFTPTNNWGE